VRLARLRASPAGPAEDELAIPGVRRDPQHHLIADGSHTEIVAATVHALFEETDGLGVHNVAEMGDS
jgi:hypothetical protein